MCGFLERFNPAVMTAMKMVEAPLYVRAQRHSPYAPRIKTGVAWDLLVHDVDLVVRAFGGEQPESFDVKVGQFHPASVAGAEDIVEAGVRFSGGGIASVSASRLGQVKVRSMVIQELDRMIEIDLLRRGLTSYRHSSIEGDDAFVGFRQFTEIEVPEIGGAEPLVSQLDHFVDLVEGSVDADAERGRILPAHRVVDAVLSGTPADDEVGVRSGSVEVDPADPARRYAGHDGAGRDVGGDDGARADDGLVADRDTHVDDCVGADEDVVADGDRAPLDLGEAAAGDAPLRRGVRVDVHAGGDVAARGRW